MGLLWKNDCIVNEELDRPVGKDLRLEAGFEKSLLSQAYEPRKAGKCRWPSCLVITLCTRGPFPLPAYIGSPASSSPGLWSVYWIISYNSLNPAGPLPQPLLSLCHLLLQPVHPHLTSPPLPHPCSSYLSHAPPQQYSTSSFSSGHPPQLHPSLALPSLLRYAQPTSSSKFLLLLSAPPLLYTPSPPSFIPFLSSALVLLLSPGTLPQ